MKKQLDGMTAGQLADLSQWAANSGLRNMANAVMKRTAKTGLSRILAQTGTPRLIDSLAWGHLATGAEVFASVRVADVLRSEGPGLVEDLAGWVAEKEEAAEAGDVQAGTALLLVRHLFGCFVLLAQRLNPSAKAIERLGAVVALSVLMGVVVGTINANSPRTLERWNSYLSSPLGILGVYLGLAAVGKAPRPRRNKPSLNRRGNSKPRTKVLQRVRHR
jgi:hypothetical protein